MDDDLCCEASEIKEQRDRIARREAFILLNNLGFPDPMKVINGKTVLAYFFCVEPSRRKREQRFYPRQENEKKRANLAQTLLKKI